MSLAIISAQKFPTGANNEVSWSKNCLNGIMKSPTFLSHEVLLRILGNIVD